MSSFDSESLPFTERPPVCRTLIVTPLPGSRGTELRVAEKDWYVDLGDKIGTS